MKKFEIFEHKIYKLIKSSILEVVEIAHDKFKKRKGEWSLNKRNFFVHTLFSSMCEVRDKLDDLKYSSIFIKNYPRLQTWRKNISREKYIIYHLEYYAISQIAIFDRFLHFCNIVYDLGLDDRYVTCGCIIKNSHVSDDCKEALKKFDNYLNNEKKVRGIQNKIKHKGKLTIKELSDANIIEYVSRMDNEKDGEKKKYESFAKLSYEIFIGTKRQEMKKEISEIEGFVEKILDATYVKIEQRYNKFIE